MKTQNPTTLGPKDAPEDQHDAPGPEIFIFSTTTPIDYEKAYKFIGDGALRKRLTVAIIDECDEVTMGKGKNSLKTTKHEDEYEDDDEYEDEDDDEYEDDDEHDDSEHYTRVAKSEAYLRHLISPTCLLFFISGTLSSCYTKKLPHYIEEEVAPFFRIIKYLTRTRFSQNLQEICCLIVFRLY